MTAKRLPLWAALSAALLYGLTLCWGTTVNSLPLAARVAGWDWRPTLDQPLTWLVTLPLHLLPASWLPAGLNLFFVLGAALTVGLLARSVQLLPWDCPPPEDKPWLASLPVLLASGVCALQFNFWQEATAATGAMLNQLLLAAVSWGLLEYRAGSKLRWLQASAVLWGAGMAQSWLLLVNLPMFIIALIWLRRRRFFKGDFPLRMAALGLAGFSLYALLPLVNGLNPHSPLTFGTAWLATLKASKATLWALYFNFWGRHRAMTLVVILFYLAALLPMVVRLKDRGLKNIAPVERLQQRIYRCVRGGLLLMLLWLAFNPVIGPPSILARQFGVALPLLSFVYLNALGIGFLAGSLLFVLQVKPEPGRLNRLEQKRASWQRRAARVLMSGVIVVILFALALRNAPAIMAANRQPLEKFGALASRTLPAEGGILLGDNVAQLAAVQAALARAPKAGRWQVVDLPALAAPDYRAVLERQQPLGWLTESNRHDLNVVEEFRLLGQLAQTHRLFFLQPGPGQLLFEQFAPQPAGLVAELKLPAPGLAVEPPLPALALAAGEKFWAAAWSQQIEPLVPPMSQSRSPLEYVSQAASRGLMLEPVSMPEREALAGWYSCALDAWGVALQRAGKLSAAQRRFEQALALVATNWSADINLQANTNLQAGHKLAMDGLEIFRAQFQSFPALAQALKAGGPVDEPVVCFELGRSYEALNWPRQARQQLERARILAPGILLPEFALAEFYSRCRLDDQVFALVKQLRPQLAALPANQMEVAAIKLDLLEAKAWMSQTNRVHAGKILQSILNRHPGDRAAADQVWGAYLNFGDFTNALALLTQQLAGDPDNPTLLNNQAGLLLLLGKTGQAVTVFQHSLAITNLPAMRLNLAAAYLQNQDLPAAEAEYHRLEAQPADVYLVHAGLADIAAQRHDTNLAIHHLEICLTNAPPGSARWQEVRARLDALQVPAHAE